MTVPSVSKNNVAGEFGVIALALQEQFALLPAERAARRAAFVRDLKPPFGPWRAAAASLRDNHPALAALDRGLVDRVAEIGTQKRGRGPAPASGASAAMPDANWSYRLDVPGPATKPARRSGGRTAAQPAGWVTVLIILSLIRACGSVTTRDPTPKYEYRPPKYSVPDPLISPQRENEDIKEMLRRLREEAGRPNPAPDSKPAPPAPPKGPGPE